MIQKLPTSVLLLNYEIEKEEKTLKTNVVASHVEYLKLPVFLAWNQAMK